ncbi:MAG TPA: hypothetical protein VF755_02410 [Catenuloplanes sp.]
MEFTELEKIEKVVHYLYDAGALICLEQQPYRYTQLGQALTDWSGRSDAKAELGRTRNRLLRMNCIAKKRNGNHYVYTLTPAGRLRLDQIRGIVEAVRDSDVMDL